MGDALVGPDTAAWQKFPLAINIFPPALVLGYFLKELSWVRRRIPALDSQLHLWVSGVGPSTAEESLLVSSHQELVYCSLRWIFPITVVNLFLWLGSLWFTYAKYFAIKLPHRAKQAFIIAAEGLFGWLNRVFCFCSHDFFITGLWVLILGLHTAVTISFHEMVLKYRQKRWWCWEGRVSFSLLHIDLSSLRLILCSLVENNIFMRQVNHTFPSSKMRP